MEAKQGQPCPPPPIEFEVTFLEDLSLLFIEFTLKEPTISPSIMRVIPAMGVLPTLPPKYGVVVSGRGPTWLTAFVLHLYHYGTVQYSYDPRLGAICVSSHRKGTMEGDIIPPEQLGK